jgi:hypothetical protein
VNELSHILARALALDVEQYPEVPPAEVSATSRTGTSRRRPDRIISGRLHPDDCGTRLQVVVGGGSAA